ncbi:MAG: DMT family transporter [Myxococcales bacterium]|nr:DMT family transporter [Myxococcales bacterium]
MRGILLMVVASALFAVMASLVKLGTNDLGYHPLEIVLWRAGGALPPALWVGRHRLAVQAKGWLLARVTFGFTSLWMWFTATRGLSVGELSVLARLQPIFVTLLAPRILGGSERMGPGVWLAIGLGLVGSVVMLGEDLSAPSSDRAFYAALAMGGALFSAVAHVSLRALGATEDPRTVVLWFQVAITVFAAILIVGTGVRLSPPPVAHLPILLGIGLLAVTGQLAMTEAYRSDAAPRVATASYAGPVFGFGLDVVVFGLVPSTSDGAGALLVVMAGVVLLRLGTRSSQAA